MAAKSFLTRRIDDILAIARLAPSVHNTQPWKVVVAGDRLSVDIDKSYMLHDGDPTGRETIISLGIFTEALCLGVTGAGLAVKSAEYRDHSVSIACSEKAGSDTDHPVKYIGLLRARASDRSIFRQAEISSQTLRDIRSSGTAPGIETVVSTDDKVIRDVAELTGKGIGLALSNPAFRQELSRYLVLPWSKKRRGIAVRSLYIPAPLAWLQPWMLRAGRGVGKEAALEKQRWLSASAVVLLLGDGDTDRYWFEAGRAYLRVSLAIEAAGLSQATSAAVVEASNYHEDIEQLLGTNKRILAMLRVGRGSDHRHYSPRISAAELLHRID